AGLGIELAFLAHQAVDERLLDVRAHLLPRWHGPNGIAPLIDVDTVARRRLGKPHGHERSAVVRDDRRGSGHLRGRLEALADRPKEQPHLALAAGPAE